MTLAKIFHPSIYTPILLRLFFFLITFSADFKIRKGQHCLRYLKSKMIWSLISQYSYNNAQLLFQYILLTSYKWLCEWISENATQISSRSLLYILSGRFSLWIGMMDWRHVVYLAVLWSRGWPPGLWRCWLGRLSPETPPRGSLCSSAGHLGTRASPPEEHTFTAESHTTGINQAPATIYGTLVLLREALVWRNSRWILVTHH